MKVDLSDTLRQKVADGLVMPVPRVTRRDVHVPAVPGKALAVVGTRRAGKSSFLWQLMDERLARGAPREALLYVNFEDERLVGMEASDLQHVVEGYFRLHPERRDRERVGFFLDEIQVVPGWERFARRLIDGEQVDLFLSGSSARLLSREVATSMRGRALEVLVHPFSFRESLRHVGDEPRGSWNALPKAVRSALHRRLDDYLAHGGFPEAQGLAPRDRVSLLRSYMDVALLRDVIERHGITNAAAARWTMTQLLANPAGTFSVEKLHRVLKSAGLTVGRATVHELLGHFEDAFLIRIVGLQDASARRRLVNPRKAYPVDPALIPLYERAGRPNTGHALETAVCLELERRGAEVGYLRTGGGHEVDFHARLPDRSTWLIQVCAEATDPGTLLRETRGLVEGHALHPSATPLLLTLGPVPPADDLPAPLRWQSAAAWLLGEPLEPARGR